MNTKRKQEKKSKADYHLNREYLKNRQLLAEAFEKELQDCLAKNKPEKLIDCVGAAAYYKVPEAQLWMAQHLMKTGSPAVMTDLKEYAVMAAYSGSPKAQMFLAECYRAGYLFKQNENLADQLEAIARFGFENRK